VRYIRPFLLLAIAVLLVIRFTSSSTPRTPKTSGKLSVAATIFPLADWLREIAGPDADVICLVAHGQNPHHFQPTVQDVTRISQARAFFAVGLELDPWAQSLASNAGIEKDRLHFIGEWVAPSKMHEPAEIEIHSKNPLAHPEDDHDEEHHHHGELDPHVWLDPARAIVAVKKMSAMLTVLDPAHSDGYTQRTEAYVQRLQALNDQIEALKAKVSAQTQVVTFHDAYGYLFARLNIKIAAVVQVSPGVEPSARDVTKAVAAIRAIGQRVVFHEPGSNTAAVEEIAKELNAGIETLDPIETESNEAGTTYVDRMRHDLKAIGALIERK
jgi:ABC-type Zn uptake system ZnuABC Zn-binding protein ZnuA